MIEETGCREHSLFLFFLHPKIGVKNSADIAGFTGVNENTLLGWMCQKK
jgi:hypothetical protein